MQRGLLPSQMDFMNILNLVDNFLNSITMYRLLLYYLILLIVVAFIYSIFGILPFTPLSLIFSVSVLLLTSFAANEIFRRLFHAQTNIESLYITALILALIISPIKTFAEVPFLIIVAVVAMASKYIFAINKKHVFNPAAIAVIITGFIMGKYASWWIGTLWMFPWSLLGILIVRKIRRFDLVFYFFVTSLVSLFGISVMHGNTDLFLILKNAFFDSPILFFAFIMLTEPLTTPPTALLQSIYGGIVGLLFSPLHIGAIFTTPEIALC